MLSTRYILHLPRRDISFYLKKKKKYIGFRSTKPRILEKSFDMWSSKSRGGRGLKLQKSPVRKFNFRARERPIQSNDRKRVSRIAGEREGGEGAYEKGERKKRCVPRLVRTIPSINLPAMCEFAALRRMLFPTPVRQSRHGVRCTPPGKRRTHF